MSDKKVRATVRTKEREEALQNYLNEGFLLKEEADKFACTEQDLANLYQEIYANLPTLSKVTLLGGLGNHKDLAFHTAGEKEYAELKTCEKKVNPERLVWQPWEGAVQFCQAPILSKRKSLFLGDCGRPMIAAWFETHVCPFMREHLPSLTIPTCEDYSKIAMTMGGHKKNTPAAKLIQHLRAFETDQEALQARWLLFENEWFATHQPNLSAFEEVLKEILEQKDWWININKNGAFLIEGFLVKGLTYVGTAKKKEGGTVFRYRMALQKKKSGGEVKEVPFVLKFYWKNGGQAVQNLNLLMVSDSFEE